jgi:hypothetical protein
MAHLSLTRGWLQAGFPPAYYFQQEFEDFHVTARFGQTRSPSI